MSLVEGGDWQTVGKKKGSKNRGAPRTQCVISGQKLVISSQDCQGGDEDCQIVMLKIHQAKEELRTSELWDSFQNTIQEYFNKCLQQVNDNPAFNKDELHVKARQSVQPELLPQHFAQNYCDQQVEYFKEDHLRSCVCYGIGRFSFDLISRYQLAFLLLLLEKLQIPKCQCHVYDPLFSGSEIEILKTLGFNVILENEEGKRRVASPTIFFMMHCGKALYNNLLWKNWSVEDLSKMVIIGNSFQGFEERLLAKVFQRDYAYISKVMNGTEEKAFPQTAQYAEIFNDTAIHWFPLQKLKGLQSEVWMVREEPVYDESEVTEIIRNQRK